MNAQGAQGAPSIEHLCAFGGVSRAHSIALARFARHSERRRICATKFRRSRSTIASMAIGGSATTWRIHGLKVNHKHVLRLMREDNLLCLRQKPFVPYTTNSRHEFPIVPNLTRALVPQGSIRFGSPTSPMSGWRSVCLSRRRSRRFFAQGDRLGARRPSRGELGDRGARHGLDRPRPPAGRVSITLTGACNMPAPTIAKSCRSVAS